MLGMLIRSFELDPLRATRTLEVSIGVFERRLHSTPCLGRLVTVLKYLLQQRFEMCLEGVVWDYEMFDPGAFTYSAPGLRASS